MTQDKAKKAGGANGASGQPGNILPGILAVILSGFLLSGMDASAKALLDHMQPMQVIWARYFFTTVLVGSIFLVRRGPGFLKMKAPRLQLIRSLFLLAVTVSIYSALQFVSLADATAVMFFAPVLVTLLAGVILKEKVGIRRLLAVVAGFVGVLLIVRPGRGDAEPALLLALLAALFLASYFLTTRMLHGRDDPDTTLFHGTSAGTIVLTLAVPFFWTQPQGVDWILMIMTGTLGACGHFMLIYAFSQAAASVLSPFLNFQLVAATLYSVVLFGDMPDLWFFAGSSLVIGAGLFIWWRERTKGQAS